MAVKQDKPVDGLRRRCRECGHPQVEHRQHTGCSVPKCACKSYQPRVDRSEGPTKT